ncbi:hypothetical protein [Kribbella sp. CA-293567]|uniref:hypothetical protein n=1 Tax=Kribbella sp. CA-293567 TaxID=3002436 RepID=UPI0022DD83A5|nr:hypothetical protein [Kribbella sp. CA-293567]WBQ03802.1 hypothetical protein OX958_28010 [Kribbella sp. CA-293567]
MTETTIRVEHQDRYVIAPTAFKQVRADVIESDATEITTYLKPADARKLAKALTAAAKVAEGKTDPGPLIDGEGDRWTFCGRNDAGKALYRFSPRGAQLTRAQIRDGYTSARRA